MVGTVLSNPVLAHALQANIRQVSERSYIRPSKERALVKAGWEAAVERAFEDGILTEEEEAALTAVKDQFQLQQSELDAKGAYTRLVKGAVLREVLEGRLPRRLHIDGAMPFNLQKSERLVWVFQNVKYFEQKTRTQYVGGSQGVSLRIAKGVYYRVGAFKAQRVQTTATVHADTGVLGVTNKHIYFFGPAKRFRVAFAKIVSFEAFSDGIGIQRDAASAKPQTFVTGDGWFTYNLVANLSQT